MKTHTKIAIATSIAVIGGIALAGAGMARGGFGGHHGGPWGGDGPRAMLMEQFDADGNGELSQAEIDEGLRSRMVSADSNGDGRLDLEEFQPLLVEIIRPRIVDGFQFLDADGDAGITMEEIERPVTRVVSRLDRNDDGVLSEDELQRRHKGWRGHRDDDDDDDS